MHFRHFWRCSQVANLFKLIKQGLVLCAQSKKATAAVMNCQNLLPGWLCLLYTETEKSQRNLGTEHCKMKMRRGRKFGDILCLLQNLQTSSAVIWRRTLSLAATLWLQNERKINLALILFSAVTLHILWFFRGIILFDLHNQHLGNECEWHLTNEETEINEDDKIM